MKIQLIKRKLISDDKSTSESYSYKIKNCEYCCDGIKNIPNLDLYFEEAQNTIGKDIGIMMCHQETTYEGYSYDDYGLTEYYYYKLNFCPICGEKIDIEIIDTIDVSEELQRLEKERKKIYIKLQKTNRISKQNEYRRELKELNKKINNLCSPDILPDRQELKL